MVTCNMFVVGDRRGGRGWGCGEGDGDDGGGGERVEGRCDRVRVKQ